MGPWPENGAVAISSACSRRPRALATRQTRPTDHSDALDHSPTHVHDESPSSHHHESAPTVEFAQSAHDPVLGWPRDVLFQQRRRSVTSEDTRGHAKTTRIKSSAVWSVKPVMVHAQQAEVAPPCASPTDSDTSNECPSSPAAGLHIRHEVVQIDSYLASSSLSSPSAPPPSRLRRSGAGGFYERAMSSENLCLSALLRKSQQTDDDEHRDQSERPDTTQQSNTISDRDVASDVKRADAVALVGTRSSNPSEEDASSPSAHPPTESDSNSSETVSPRVELDRAHLLGVLACTLEQLCPLDASLPTDPHFLSLFHTSSLPSISIRDYLVRLATYTCVSDECLILACIHIVTLARNGRDEAVREAVGARRNNQPTSKRGASDEAISSPSSAKAPSQPYPHPRINSFSDVAFVVDCYNIHRLLLAALLTAAKFCDDAFYNNLIYANLGGISLKELNRLECEYLQLIDYRLRVTAEVFLHEYAQMNGSAAHGEWCTHPHHSLGPVMRMHQEDEPLYSVLPLEEEANAESSTFTSVHTRCEYTVHERTVYEQVRRTRSNSSMSSVHAFDETLDLMQSVNSSAATTPRYIAIPSSSPPSPPTVHVNVASDEVTMPDSDLSPMATSHSHGVQMRISSFLVAEEATRHKGALTLLLAERHKMTHLAVEIASPTAHTRHHTAHHDGVDRAARSNDLDEYLWSPCTPAVHEAHARPAGFQSPHA